MRILIVSDVSSHMRGGVPTETRSLIRGLVERGHTVALASNSPLAGAEQALHLPITIPVNASLVTEVGRAVATFKPEFVHVLCMSSKGVMQLAPLLRSHPWALTVHSVPPYERKLQRWHRHEGLHYGARALRFMANSLAWRWVFHSGMVPRVIVHSEYVEDIVVRYGFSRSRVKLIPLPFEPPVPTQIVSAELRNIEAPLITTVGGFAHTKGQHDVVEALPDLIKRFPRIHYQIIGEVRDPSYVNYLVTLARRLEVTDHLQITPDLSQEEKGLRLTMSDVYVQPSHEEGFCLAFAEAAAVVPRLIGTDAGAMADIGQDDVGMRIVRVRQAKSIAGAVCDLLDTHLTATHMADRAIRLAGLFSSAGYLQSHETLYASAGQF